MLEYPELGMEAVWKIEVQDFPAFIVVDDKGNDFFDLVNKPCAVTGHAPLTATVAPLNALVSRRAVLPPPRRSARARWAGRCASRAAETGVAGTEVDAHQLAVGRHTAEPARHALGVGGGLAIGDQALRERSRNRGRSTVNVRFACWSRPVAPSKAGQCVPLAGSSRSRR